MALGLLPDLPNGVKVRFAYTQANRPMFNIIHMTYSTSAPSVAELNTVSGILMSTWTTNIKNLMHSGVTLNFIDVQDVSSRSGAYYQNTTGGVGGTTPTNALPNNVALCVSLKVAKRYRGGHPRLYLPGQLLANTTTTTSWTNAWCTTVNNAFTAVLAAINGITAGSNTYAMVAASYYTHDANHNQIYKTPAQTYPIVSTAVHTRIDSQRRRLGKETT